jgi:hypothetical protein
MNTKVAGTMDSPQVARNRVLLLDFLEGREFIFQRVALHQTKRMILHKHAPKIVSTISFMSHALVNLAKCFVAAVAQYLMRHLTIDGNTNRVQDFSAFPSAPPLPSFPSSVVTSLASLLFLSISFFSLSLAFAACLLTLTGL